METENLDWFADQPTNTPNISIVMFFGKAGVRNNDLPDEIFSLPHIRGRGTVMPLRQSRSVPWVEMIRWMAASMRSPDVLPET